MSRQGHELEAVLVEAGSDKPRPSASGQSSPPSRKGEPLLGATDQQDPRPANGGLRNIVTAVVQKKKLNQGHASPTERSAGGRDDLFGLHRRGQEKAGTPRSDRSGSGKGDGLSKKSSGSDVQWGSDIDDEVQEPKAVWYRRRRLWTIWVPMFLILACIGSGILIYELNPVKSANLVYSFPLYKWFFFFGGVVAIWFIGEFIVRAAVYLIESQFFNTKNVLYFLAAIRKPLANMIRALLLLPLFIVIFLPVARANTAVSSVYHNCLKAIAVIILFCFVNVLKTLLTKKLASHFHKETFFEKMQLALRKEYYLLALATPSTQAKDLRATGDMETPSSAYHYLSKMTGSLLFSNQDRSSSVPDNLHNLGPDSSSPKRHFGRSASAPTPDPFGGGRAASERPPTASTAASSAAAVPVAPATASAATSVPQATTDAAPAASREGHGGSQAFPMHEGLAAIPETATAAPPIPETAAPAGTAAPEVHVPPAHTVNAQKHWNKVRILHRAASSVGKAKHIEADKMDADSADSADDDDMDSVADTATESDRDDQDILVKLQNMERHIRKNKIMVPFTDRLGEYRKASPVRTDAEARRLAYYIYMNVKPRDRSYILLEDLKGFLTPNKAKKAFEMLDEDGDGRVTAHDMLEAVLKIFRERTNLALQLRDTKTVVGRLESVIGTTLHIIFIMVYLIIFNVSVLKLWLSFSSIVLAFTFVFGNSIRNMFEAVIFLFIIHPYDVGDSLVVNGDDYRVEEISLTTTVMRRSDGSRLWYPNGKLASDPLLNKSRSDNKSDSFKILVDISTSAKVLEALTEAVGKHIAEHASEFSSSKSVNLGDCVAPLKITLSVGFEYSHNGVDRGRMSRARTGLYTVIIRTLSEQGVAYSFPQFQQTSLGYLPEHFAPPK